ncbi:hypothetical protein [Undibacterium luofuense]|uniref:hypothetical protein n=1 Tax=Undibacterium luofuense TaxID=2828733 RepID=UPI0030EC8923
MTIFAQSAVLTSWFLLPTFASHGRSLALMHRDWSLRAMARYHAAIAITDERTLYAKATLSLGQSGESAVPALPR